MKHRLRILELAVQRHEELARQGVILDLTPTLRIWSQFVEDGILPNEHEMGV